MLVPDMDRHREFLENHRRILDGTKTAGARRLILGALSRRRERPQFRVSDVFGVKNALGQVFAALRRLVLSGAVAISALRRRTVPLGRRVTCAALDFFTVGALRAPLCRLGGAVRVRQA